MLINRKKENTILPISVLTQIWIRDNIFNFRKGDSAAYLALYIMIPVIITFVSLHVLSDEGISIIYCYITILISALNGIYDSANRWESNSKSIRNTKLFIIMGADAVIAVYCIYVIMYILISSEANCRFDWWLLVYFATIAVSMFDFVTCFSREMALWNYERKGEV